jgi:GxxExxY protein
VLGPGLLESAYQVCLIHELRKRGMHIEAEVPVPVIYDGIKLECGYRIDIVVENSVVLELKAIEAIAPIHEAQLISYIKLSGNRLGLSSTSMSFICGTA